MDQVELFIVMTAKGEEYTGQLFINEDDANAECEEANSHMGEWSEAEGLEGKYLVYVREYESLKEWIATGS